MTREIKLKLMLYALISAVTFYLFAGVPNASIGVPVFAVIQAICLYFCAPDKKVLIKFIPIIILCTNSFVSASPLWTVPNFVVCGVLYGCMFTDFSFKDT